MHVSILLQAKGTEVVQVPPTVTVGEVAAVLTERRIGAVVVSEDGRHLDGIVSERDIVAALARHGAEVLAQPAGSIMTAEVTTCAPDTTIETLMALMTDRRVRHVPVLVDDEISGVVSIGDVVKDRISTLEFESAAMAEYISNPR